MIKSFLAFLGGEEGEEKPMLLLLGMGFCMGVYLACYQIGSETIFLMQLGEAYLDTAFFTSGGLGIIATILFVWLQRKIPFSTLVISYLFLIFIFMAGTRFAFYFTGYDESDAGFQILPFVMFVMIGPVTAITILSFWGTFGRMFDLRASKRVIGGIDTGALIATVIAFFSIPFITTYTSFNATYDLLFVSAIASFGMLFFTIWIVKDFNLDRATKISKEDAKKVKKVTFLDLFKDPYLRLLSLFLIFSMSAAVFVDYTFLSVMEINYPDEQELSNFLSGFSGVVVLMSFGIQSFLNDYIIGKFGLRTALMVMPLILLLFTLGGIVSGHLFEYQIRTEEFLYFFLFTACAKAFTFSLRDALESPAFKLFFLPIDVKIRFDIQTRIEGVVNQIATFAAGLAQIVLGFFAFFKLIHYSYFIVGLALMVIYLANKLFNQYKVTLKITLEEQKKALQGAGKRNTDNILNHIKNELSQKEVERAINGFKLLERIDPIQFEFALLDGLNSRFPKIRAYCYKRLGDNLCFSALDIIKKDAKTEGDDDVLEAASICIALLEEANQFELNEQSLRKLIRSTDSKDRIRGARLLVKSTDDKHLPFVMELLRDINPAVRAAAMITAGKLRRPELWPVLVESLHIPTYSNTAFSALSLAGDAAFHTIDSAFYKTGQHVSTMIRIIQLFGRIGGKEAIDLLWKKIDYPDKRIVSELLLSLSYLGFQSRDFQSARIKINLESEIGDIAWNIKALQEVPEDNELDILIKTAFKEEDRRNYNNLFMLLSMIYDSQNILLIKENIQDGNTESITFAVEMMDIFVEEELKPKLFPVMDELKVEEKLARLQNNFPPEYFDSYEDLLLQIINRDYNRINRYTKALSLFRIAQMEEAKVTDDLIANLFNPDHLLLETAAATIYKLDKEQYHLHTKRLKSGIKKDLDKAILPPVFRGEDEDYHQKLLLIERIIFLKEAPALKSIPGELIAELAESLEEIRINSGAYLIEEGTNAGTPVYFILDGVVDIYQNDRVVMLKERGAMVGHEIFASTDTFDFTAIARTQITALVLTKEILFDLMSKHIELVDFFIRLVNQLDAEEMEEEPEISDILIGA